jgi:hypothetical protein
MAIGMSEKAKKCQMIFQPENFPTSLHDADFVAGFSRHLVIKSKMHRWIFGALCLAASGKAAESCAVQNLRKLLRSLTRVGVLDCGDSPPLSYWLTNKTIPTCF